MSDSESRELALRAHIRNLLLDYSLTHLTTNYVTFTQDAVTELLSTSLTFVPETDPTDPLFPTDPFETISRRWSPDTVEQYEEHWTAEGKAIQCLKQQLHMQGRRPTLRCWDSDIDENYDNWLSRRPMSPVLTTRAIRETPKPGSKSVVDMFPPSHVGILSPYGIGSVEVEEIIEQAPIKLIEALDIKLIMDSETHAAVLGLVRSVPGLSKQSNIQHEWTDIRGFLRADSPMPRITEFASPPLFPRDRQPGYKTVVSIEASANHSSGLSNISDLPSLVPQVEIQKNNEEEELYKQHMVVVNGWQAYEVPSSPLTAGTPSLGDSSSEIDELFLPSPPDGNRPLIQSMLSAQMEEYEFPRTEKIGGVRTRPKALGEDRNLASFLSPFLNQSHPQQAQARIVTTPRSQPSSPRTSITMSMIGQAASVTNGHSEIDTDDRRRVSKDLDSEGSDWDLDTVIQRVCGESLGDEDFKDLILKEKLDEKDSMLMDVPRLPPPNEHPPSTMFLPITLTDLLFTTRSSTNPMGDTDVVKTDKISGCRVFKKVKGLQSLNIELTWRPFKFGRTKPTDEEVAKVEESIRDTLVKAMDLGDGKVMSELSCLLKEVQIPPADSANETTLPPSMREWRRDDFEIHSDVPLVSDPDTRGMILTREERRRLYKLPDNEFREDDEDLGSSDKENETRHLSPQAASIHLLDRPRKRIKVDAGVVSPNAATARSSYGAERWQSEDSGIFIAPYAQLDRNVNDGLFGQLALSAEGFEGPNADGDLFEDMDPIHCIGFSLRPLDDQTRHSTYPIANQSKHSSPSASTSSQDCNRIDLRTSTHNVVDDFAAPLPVSFDTEQVQSVNILETFAQPIPFDNHLSRTRASPAQLGAMTVPLMHQADCNRHAIGSLTFLPLDPCHSLKSSVNADLEAPPSASAADSLTQFLRLVGKNSLIQTATESNPVHANEPLTVSSETQPEADRLGPSACSIPEELLDDRTLRLQEQYILPTTCHRYMVSMEFIQKRTLVRALSSRDCAVDLVERDQLGDVQLIIDPDSAVVFMTLATLPSQVETLTVKLSQLSWQYAHILVIFEAYPSSWCFQRDRGSPRSAPYAFSPPVVKAVKKLRRDLSIAEAYQTKCASTVVQLAYANSIQEAAMLARVFGDLAETRDATCGAIWGDRNWLDLDEQEGEYDLSCIDGMNAFVASIILSHMPLEEFLDIAPEQRLQYFAGLVGAERIDRFNTEIARRTEVIQFPSSSPEHCHPQVWEATG